MGKTAQHMPSPALSTMFHLPFYSMDTVIRRSHRGMSASESAQLCWWLVLVNNGWAEKDNTSKTSFRIIFEGGQ